MYSFLNLKKRTWHKETYSFLNVSVTFSTSLGKDYRIHMLIRTFTITFVVCWISVLPSMYLVAGKFAGWHGDMADIVDTVDKLLIFRFQPLFSKLTYFFYYLIISISVSMYYFIWNYNFIHKIKIGCQCSQCRWCKQNVYILI